MLGDAVSPLVPRHLSAPVAVRCADAGRPSRSLLVSGARLPGLFRREPGRRASTLTLLHPLPVLRRNLPHRGLVHPRGLCQGTDYCYYCDG